MSDGTAAHDPSVRFADTSPASLGRKVPTGTSIRPSPLSVVRFAKVLSALMLAGCAASGTIGGAYYDPAYDYSEFFAVTDGRNFQVVIAGAPFPDLPAAAV